MCVTPSWIRRPGSVCKPNAWRSVGAALLLCVAAAIASPAQTFTTIANFGQPQSGGEPNWGALAQGLDGNFYGATLGGGRQGAGTVYRMTPSGKLTKLDALGGDSGSAPFGGLVQATGGWPTFTFFVKVGTHAADAGVFILTSPH